MAMTKEYIALDGPSLAEFESLEIDVATFDHTAHIFVAWSYLQRYDLLTAIERYRRTLLKLTTRLGIPEKYHETITWFFLIVIAERNVTSDGRWSTFKSANSDLFASDPGILEHYYAEATLRSDLSKRLFLLPNLKSPLPRSNSACAAELA